MNIEAPRYLAALADKLFPVATDKRAFETALLAPSGYQSALIWLNERPAVLPFSTAERPDWLPDCVDLVKTNERPGAHELHQLGAYYVLDASSVFCGSVLRHCPGVDLFVFDICASPGGKSIFAWHTLKPKLLVANEVVGKRLGALTGNFTRCSIAPAYIYCRDSKHLAKSWKDTADIVIVDAPCSGQSLLAKGEHADGCFHPLTMKRNAQRQRRILANSSQIVAPGGYLAYMTCTFSLEENEKTIAWFLKRFPEFTALEVQHLTQFRSSYAEFPAYRLWPQSGIGAGGFTVLLQNNSVGKRATFSPDCEKIVWQS